VGAGVWDRRLERADSERSAGFACRTGVLASYWHLSRGLAFSLGSGEGSWAPDQVGDDGVGRRGRSNMVSSEMSCAFLHNPFSAAHAPLLQLEHNKYIF
jgi:hypothetical protein